MSLKGNPATVVSTCSYNMWLSLVCFDFKNFQVDRKKKKKNPPHYCISEHGLLYSILQRGDEEKCMFSETVSHCVVRGSLELIP